MPRERKPPRARESHVRMFDVTMWMQMNPPRSRGGHARKNNVSIIRMILYYYVVVERTEKRSPGPNIRRDCTECSGDNPTVGSDARSSRVSSGRPSRKNSAAARNSLAVFVVHGLPGSRFARLS